MDLVTVPLLSPNDEISSALDLLKRVRRSGLVRQDATDVYTLLYIGRLRRAQAKGLARLEDCEGGHRIVVLDLPLAGTFGLDLVRPLRTAVEYEQMLDARAAEYALVAENVRDVMLVTRYERLTVMLSATGGYECTGNPTHFYPDPDVQLGDKCPERAECWVDGAPEPIIQLS